MRGEKRRRGSSSSSSRDWLELDRLSDLPDELLFLIISSISTNEAVRTSTLSGRWRRLYTLIPSTDILYIDSDPINPESFQHRLSSQSGLIRRCQIKRPMGLPGFCIQDWWVQALKTKGIKELVLDNNPALPCTIPSCVLDVKSLTVLDLKTCQLPLCTVGCTNLRTLKLERVTLTEHLLGNIFSACLQLEKLHMVGCNGLEISSKIHASSLKHLWLQSLARVTAFEMVAPNLQSLKLETWRGLKDLNLHAPKIRKVYLKLTKPSGISAATRLKGFLAASTDLSCLTLRGASVQHLSQVGKCEVFKTPFQMLKTLSMSVDLGDESEVLFIVELLESCHRLQKLYLSITQSDFPGSWGFRSFEHGERLQRLQCFSYHLEQVRLSGFSASAYQIKLAELILREAKVLKKMTLWLQKICSSQQLNAARELLSLKKASTQGVLISHATPRIQVL